MFEIGIICGHGAGDTGAVSKKWGTEADLVRKLAPYIVDRLEQYKDVHVTLLNTKTNWYDELTLRYRDFAKYDYVIELHANAGAHDPKGNGHTTGFEVWVTNAEEGISVEETMCKNVCSKWKLRNRGVKRCDFLVIGEIKRQGVSCCLIENGFMDDDDDMKIIQSNIKAYAETIADAVAEGFDFKKKSQPKPKPAGQPHKVAVYMTSYGNFRFVNLDPRDKVIRHSDKHGLFDVEIEICGNRNLYEKYDAKKEVGYGEKHGLKNEGEHLFVAFADELKFDINEKLK